MGVESFEWVDAFIFVVVGSDSFVKEEYRRWMPWLFWIAVFFKDCDRGVVAAFISGDRDDEGLNRLFTRMIQLRLLTNLAWS